MPTRPLPGRRTPLPHGGRCARWLAIVTAAWIAWPLHAAPAASLPDELLRALAQAKLPLESASLLVAPVDGGPARLSHRATQPRSVASVMKLFTTGAALQVLGPAFTWHTDVALGGPLQPDGTLQGPLLLRGQGDPSLSIEALALWMSRWRGAGLRRIDGDLLLDRSAFVLPEHDPAAFDGQPLKPYNAGPDALLLAHQALTLRLRPDLARADQARVSLEPELSGVRLIAKVTLDEQAACGDWRQALALTLDPDPAQAGHWTLTLQGRYPSACGERAWPLHWAAGTQQDHTERVLGMAWHRAGGEITGQIRAGVWPVHAQPWMRWESPPLAQVVRDINKFSNNVMARQVFLTLGHPEGTEGAPATLEAARQRVARQVRQATTADDGHSPCEGDALVLDNGSGLSRSARASAACVGRWLQALWAGPVMPELLASLPVAGVDGTARQIDAAAGRAHLKTGSLDGVSAVAGVVLGDSGRRYVVVGVINDARADTGRAALRALIDWTAHER